MAGVRPGVRVVVMLGRLGVDFEGVLGVRVGAVTDPTLDCRAGVGLGTGTAVSGEDGTGSGAGAGTGGIGGKSWTGVAFSAGAALGRRSLSRTMLVSIVVDAVPMTVLGRGGHSRFSFSSSLAASPV